MFLKNIFVFVTFFSLLLATGHGAGRERLPVLDGWKFLKRDIAPDENQEAWKNIQSPPWEVVSIPHTWNAEDGANGLVPDPDRSGSHSRESPSGVPSMVSVPLAGSDPPRPDGPSPGDGPGHWLWWATRHITITGDLSAGGWLTCTATNPRHHRNFFFPSPTPL